MKPRPVCIHCGAAYGQRHTTEAVAVWRKGEQPQPYRGNGIVLKQRDYGTLLTLTKALGRPKDDGDQCVWFDVWDGETWYGGFDPFCKLRCALSFARKAYNAGYRILPKTK